MGNAEESERKNRARVYMKVYVYPAVQVPMYIACFIN